jgi:hypothetical protein
MTAAIRTSTTKRAGEVKQADTFNRGVPFQRIAGVAGLLTLALGICQLVAVGNAPGLGASASEVADYFGADRTAHSIGVVLAAVIAIPMVVFLVGVHRTLAAADRTMNTSWSTIFLYGAVMMSATAGAREGGFAVLALRGGKGLAPESLQVMNDAILIAAATLGVWLAVAVGSVAVATFRHHIRPAWYGWLSALGAILGALSLIETVNTSTDGILATVAFLVGVIIWGTVTSVLMLGDTE